MEIWAQDVEKTEVGLPSKKTLWKIIRQLAQSSYPGISQKCHMQERGAYNMTLNYTLIMFYKLPLKGKILWMDHFQHHFPFSVWAWIVDERLMTVHIAKSDAW